MKNTPIDPALGVRIDFEGMECAGKSTALRICTRLFNSAGIPTSRTAEPTGSEAGQQARALAKTTSPDHSELLRMFSLDRADHLHGFVAPALLRGRVVLSDRGMYSTAVHQGFLGGLGINAVLRHQRQLFRPPDMLVLLSCSPDIALQRMKERDGRLSPSLQMAREKRLNLLFLAYQKLRNRADVYICTNDRQPYEVAGLVMARLFRQGTPVFKRYQAELPGSDVWQASERAWIEAAWNVRLMPGE